MDILKIFLYILEKLTDYDLKIEITNLLKCLFLGPKGFKNGVLPKCYEKIRIGNVSNEKKVDYFFDSNTISKIFEKRAIIPENAAIGSRINEERILKSCFGFICELIKDYSLKSVEQSKLRSFLLTVNKVSSNNNLRYVFH